jgi:hypothetical protein
MISSLSAGQHKRLRAQYFSAASAEGMPRFAQSCLTLARRGYALADFLEGEGPEGVYQEMLDEALAAHMASRAGHLYLAVHPIYAARLYKVGATRKTPEERMRSLTTAGIPGQFTLVKAWAVPDAFAAETCCKRTLAQRRIRGELYEGTYPELTAAMQGVVDAEWRLVCSLSQAIEMPLTSP